MEATPDKSYLAEQGALQKHLPILVLIALCVIGVVSCCLDLLLRCMLTETKATPHTRPTAEEGALQNHYVLWKRKNGREVMNGAPPDTRRKAEEGALQNHHY